MKPPAPLGAKPATPKPPKDRPHCERGDEVYFHHEGNPFVGKVLSRGEHGATLELKSGTRHQMRWENYLGHRSRVQPQLSVVDQGEDGFVARAPGGRPRYVHDPLDEGDDEDLVKAFSGQALGRILDMREDRENWFTKAIKGSAGLTLQDVTTKAGVRTKRWKRNAEPAPKERPAVAPKPAAGPPPGHHDAREGQTVKFRAGDFHGTGKIVGTLGPKGTHVQDTSGRIHTVKWDEIHERDGAPAKKEPRLVVPAGKAKKPEPKADDGQPPVDRDYQARKGAAAPHRLEQNHAEHFDTDGSVELKTADLKRQKKSSEEDVENASWALEAGRSGTIAKRKGIKVTPNEKGEHVILQGHDTHAAAMKHGWDTVPSMVVQPHDTQEKVYAAAEEATTWLKDWLNKGQGLCDQWGFETQKRAPDDVPKADWDKPGGMLFIAPTKGLERAAEKVRDDYGGDWSRLKDAARCTIAVDTIDQVHQVVDKLKAAGMVIAQPMKDRYKGKAAPGGYRDVNMVVRAPNGHLTEVQVNTKAMMEAKNSGHHDYEVTRKIEGKYKEAGNVPFDEWSKPDQRAFIKHQRAQEEIYSAAYAKLGGGK